MAIIPEGFASNFIQGLKDYDFRDWLRIVIIVGGYILVRNQFVQWRTRKYQQQQIDEDNRLQREAKEEAEQAELQKVGAVKSGSTAAKKTGAEWGWGSTAKEGFEKRRKYIQTQARRKAEMAENEDSDDDIAEYLEK